MGPYIGGETLTDKKRLFNQEISLIRILIENCFGRIGRLWQWIDWYKDMIVRAYSVGQYWPVGVLLTNCMTCFRENVVSSRFGVNPPLIEEYLNPENLYINGEGINVWPDPSGFEQDDGEEEEIMHLG